MNYIPYLPHLAYYLAHFLTYFLFLLYTCRLWSTIGLFMECSLLTNVIPDAVTKWSDAVHLVFLTAVRPWRISSAPDRTAVTRHVDSQISALRRLWINGNRININFLRWLYQNEFNDYILIPCIAFDTKIVLAFRTFRYCNSRVIMKWHAPTT